MIFKLVFITIKKICKVLICSKRLYGTQRFHICAFAAIVITLATSSYFILRDNYIPMNLSKTQLLVESRLKEYYLEEKGKGCEIPKVDPFSAEAMKFVSNREKIRCKGNDWVICNKSKCYVKKEILKNVTDITCMYRDIVYVDDSLHFISDYTELSGDEKYTLNRSDHVKVSCSGRKLNSYIKRYSRWSGLKASFRPVKTKPIPPDRKDSYNVVFLGFDSASHNGFIRKMPKSSKFLADRAIILNGYNVVGDGTPAALYPLLTGMSEYEHPDARKKITEKVFVDHELFLFHQLKKYGYRSAYFEDTPTVGTFQYRFNGFRQQPADHYLRAFLLECENEKPSLYSQQYCVGDTPQYQLLLNLTNEFLRLDGKKFGFTLIADISHDDFNLIGTADDDVAWFLETLAAERVFDDTLVMVMGDHGSRFADIRRTYQGKLEERLPLMAIILPEKLKKLRPDALTALKQNIDVLTTPFDIHTTILDVLNLKDNGNKYKVFGADLPRAMSLLEPIPKNRTCPEAGIVQHWCSCTKWSNVSHPEMFHKAAVALVEYINSISEVQRSKCARRQLISIEWVLQLNVNKHVLTYGYRKEEDAYLGNPINKASRAFKEYYQAKIILGPGRGVFEGTFAYNTQTNLFTITEKDISRISKYGDEPNCISATHPHLNKFCYCISHLVASKKTTSD